MTAYLMGAAHLFAAAAIAIASPADVAIVASQFVGSIIYFAVGAITQE